MTRVGHFRAKIAKAQCGGHVRLLLLFCHTNVQGREGARANVVHFRGIKVRKMWKLLMAGQGLWNWGLR